MPGLIFIPFPKRRTLARWEKKRMLEASSVLLRRTLRHLRGFHFPINFEHFFYLEKDAEGI